MKQSPYAVLGVDKNASPEEIKDAYREKAKKHHPDRGGDEDKFKKIKSAYERIENGEVGSGFESEDFGFRSNPNINYGQEKSVEDMLRDFKDWSDKAGFGRSSTVGGGSKKRKVVNVGFESAVYGQESLNIGPTTIRVPPGTQDGTEMFFPDIGSKVTFRVSNNTEFWRENRNDIYVKKEVSVWDAMTGGNVEVDTLDGKTVRTKIEPGSKLDSTFRFQGMGGPETFDGKPQGDFYVKLDINIPAIHHSDNIAKIDELRKETD